MTSLITIFIVLAIVWAWVRFKMQTARLEVKNELRILYGQLELQFIHEKVILNNKVLNFLGSYKTSSIHSDFLDIQVLMMIHRSRKDVDKIQKAKTDFDQVRTELSDESLQIVTNMDKYAEKMVFMSILKPDFILWLIKSICVNSISSALAFSLLPFKKTYRMIRELILEMQEIIFVGRKVAS